MKKFSVLLSMVLLLAACGDAETEADPAAEDQVAAETESSAIEENTKEVIEEAEVKTLTAENVEEIVAYNGTGEGDELISADVENGEVKVAIQLAQSDMLSNNQMAITRYSQVSDELLNYEGWETLSVEYVEVGTINMNRSEAEINDFNMTYFPTEIIESKLN